jgi:hypothetical protein
MKNMSLLKTSYGSRGSAQANSKRFQKVREVVYSRGHTNDRQWMRENSMA